jgi:branched-subunit amino acid aminotransferase/4-amino-4-deoxychorismate lyase
METLTKATPILGDGAPEVGLRETCRIVGDELPLWLRHLSRLASGGSGPSLLREAEARVTAALAARGPDDGLARLRMTVDPDRTIAVDIDAFATSLDVEDGPTFSLVTTEAPPLPQGAAKPGSREPWDRVLAATDADQAVLVDEAGFVIDGSTASVWSVRGGIATTPPAPPAVAGVARGLVLEKAREHGIEVRVAPLTAVELGAADEVFFTNAVGGAVAARGRGGPVTERVRHLFASVWELGETTGSA